MNYTKIVEQYLRNGNMEISLDFVPKKLDYLFNSDKVYALIPSIIQIRFDNINNDIGAAEVVITATGTSPGEDKSQDKNLCQDFCSSFKVYNVQRVDNEEDNYDFATKDGRKFTIISEPFSTDQSPMSILGGGQYNKGRYEKNIVIIVPVENKQDVLNFISRFKQLLNNTLARLPERLGEYLKSQNFTSEEEIKKHLSELAQIFVPHVLSMKDIMKETGIDIDIGGNHV